MTAMDEDTGCANAAVADKPNAITEESTTKAAGVAAPGSAAENTETFQPPPRKGVSFSADSKEPASTPVKPSFRTGQRVILQGLEKAREKNGHRGVIVKWKADVCRYAVRVAGKEMAIKPENVRAEGGAAEADKWFNKHKNTQGVMYNPVVYAHVPGAGPKVTQWIGQVKAGRRIMVKADREAGLDDEPIPVWFGDKGFIRSAPVEVAVLINDIGADPNDWPGALTRVLNRFPAAAGRLRSRRDPDNRSGEIWQIVTNNAGVPFTTSSVPPCGLPSAEELQLACTDEQCGFFDLGMNDGRGADADEPLLRLKLVFEEGTARGVLGISFNHVLCDIAGIGAILQWLHSELDSSERAPTAQPCMDRELAQTTFEATADATPEQEEQFLQHWPLSSPALEKWCFTARRLRSGLRGKPDGVATVFFSAPPETLAELKQEAEADGAPGSTAFEAIVCYMCMTLGRLGRFGTRALVTKDYRSALESQAPGEGLGQLFANAVTHGVSFPIPAVADLEAMPLGEACKSMRSAIDAVSLEYVRWQSKTDHFKGLPNLFGGLCCNTWGRAFADLRFVDTYAIGTRAVDERAANMAFPLDTAYMQILPQPSGAHSVLLTMPINDVAALLKVLPETHFKLPHVSDMRTHAFRCPMPGQLVTRLNPTVETHHIAARIACIGDSMTACGYPKILQALFDRAEIRTQVRSFGIPGATVQRFSDTPFWDEKRKLSDALIWRPHFVIFTFGSNDAKSNNWDSEAFIKDYTDLCMEFLERNAPKPIVYVVVPPPLYIDDAYDIQQSVVNTELPVDIPKVATAAERKYNGPIEQMAARARQTIPEDVLAVTNVIDVFSLLGGADLKRRSYIAEDGVHPNERGTKMLATGVFADTRRAVVKCLRKWADAASCVPGDPMEGM